MKKFFPILVILGLALMFGFNQAYAVGPSITPATGGSAISADTCNGSWTSLFGPVLTEAVAGDIATGTIVINAPDNIEFNTAQNVTAIVSGGANKLTLLNYTVAPEADKITFTVTAVSEINPSTITFVNIQVRPKTGSCTTLVTNNMTFSGTSSVSGDCGALTTVVGAAAKLAFTTQPPTSAVASALFNPQPVVTIQDKNGNTRTADTDEITLTAHTDANCSADTLGEGTLGGTTKMNASAGVASFSGISYTKAETIYLKASSESLAPACSRINGIEVTAGDPSKLAFVSPAPTTVPGNSYTYQNLSVQPVVEIQDAHGNKTVATNDVTIKAYTNADCSSAASKNLDGTLTVAAVSGTARFSGIKYNTINTNGIYIGAETWIDTDNDEVKDDGETKTACSPIYRVYANSSSSTSSGSSVTTTSTTSAYVAPTTTSTTQASTTNVPTTAKPISQMTQAEKTSYIMELQSFLINLLQQLLTALKTRLGL